MEFSGSTGDSLTGFVADLTQDEIDAFFDTADPHANASARLRDATTRIIYDPDQFLRTRQAYPDDPTRWQPPCALRRPTEQYVRGMFSDPDPLKPNSDPRTLNRDVLVDKIEYREPAPNATPAEETEAQRLNLRTRIYRHSDTAGVAINARLDVNGNPTEAYSSYRSMWRRVPSPGRQDQAARN